MARRAGAQLAITATTASPDGGCSAGRPAIGCLCDALRRLRRDVMKRTRRAQTDADELRAEYEFDYAKGRKNRFAASGAPTIAVVLEPDVARMVSSAAKVNRLLRAVIKAVPGTAVDRKRRAG